MIGVLSAPPEKCPAERSDLRFEARKSVLFIKYIGVYMIDDLYSKPVLNEAWHNGVTQNLTKDTLGSTVCILSRVLT